MLTGWAHFRVVAQLGQRAVFGTRRPPVRIRPTRLPGGPQMITIRPFGLDGSIGPGTLRHSNWCTVGRMGRREREQTSDASKDAFTDERGVTLTRAGVDRAGERLAESRARHTPEYFAALRERLGIPPRTA
jgi:hypothetical protein